MTTARSGTLLRHLQRLASTRGTAPWTDRQLLDDFAGRRDEAAFAALVTRHGPMVLRVCRRVLHHEQDAEDAFQATFLVLARNTGSIRKRDTVANWLHGVAYRTAMKAKRSAARRRNHETSSTAAPQPAASPTWDDVQAVLDEEIQRLPAGFRQAFVLCVLEGKGVSEAALALDCKEGTVKSRVNRARGQLRQRLARRGIQLSTLLAGLSVAESTTRASLPAALAASTVRSGLLVAAGEPAGGMIPSRVAALAAGVSRSMLLKRARLMTAFFFATSLVVAGAGTLARQVFAAGEPPAGTKTGDDQPRSVAANQAAKPSVPKDEPAVTFAGRVLDPDGKPVAGAKLYVAPASGYFRGQKPVPESATTGPDGRFRCSVPKARFGDYGAFVVATAANFGPDWVQPHPAGKNDDLTLRLVKDVPITGRVIDLEGKPVPGVTLSVQQIHAALEDDLGPFLEAAKDKKATIYPLQNQYLRRYTIAPAPQVTTDAEGRFRLTGIGRDRLVDAQLDGPTICSVPVRILTRPGKAFEVTDDPGNPEINHPRTVATYYGSDFRIAVAPCRPVVGVVRDKDTGKPLAGVIVRSYARLIAGGSQRIIDLVSTTTDARGRYRLTGLPGGPGYKIAAVPTGDEPYVVQSLLVPGDFGPGPATVDFELRRGVWIEGKMTDKETGQPLRGAAEYFSLFENPSRHDYPGYDGTMIMERIWTGSKDDGSYRVVGLPGPGLVGVYYQKDTYLRAPDRDDEFGTKEKSIRTAPYHISFTSNYNALARVDPPKGADSFKCDITLDRGWTVKGTVKGPDGKPVAGARIYNPNDQRSAWEYTRSKSADFTERFNPRWRHEILFIHPEKRLYGVAVPPKENGGSVEVKLLPTASYTGRLVGADGKPLAGVELEVTFRLKAGWGWFPYLPGRVKTDGEGRFRVDALLPGREFRLSGGKGELLLGGDLRPGQAKDAGDVRLKPVAVEE
jgi:RNA polymerase sigma factor (sigma-70 family)